MQRQFEMPVTQRLVTAEEFEQMPEEPGVRLELVCGRVIRMSPPGYRHGEVATQLLGLLLQHVERTNLGRVLVPIGFKIASSPDTVREPDIAFISRARLSGTATGPGFFQGPPDLAAEVLSPGDRRAAIASKVAQYLEGGVRMVWVIDPKQETVTVHEPSRQPVTLREGALLDGGDVVPGFSCELGQIFR